MKVLLTTAFLTVVSGIAEASDWSKFYVAPKTRATTEARAQPAHAGEMHGDCIRAILAAQARHGIPNNILLGIGLQEAGTRKGGELTVWPWAVNSAGVGRLFETRQDAIRWVQAQMREGIRSIDVGCMQINLRWHPGAFATLEDGFDPEQSAEYAAKFLLALYEKTGNWTEAAGSYHSTTPDKQAKYLASLRQKVALANRQIGAFQQSAELIPVKDARPPQRPSHASSGNGLWRSALNPDVETGRRSLFGNLTSVSGRSAEKGNPDG